MIISSRLLLHILSYSFLMTILGTGCPGPQDSNSNSDGANFEEINNVVLWKSLSGEQQWDARNVVTSGDYAYLNTDQGLYARKNDGEWKQVSRIYTANENNEMNLSEGEISHMASLPNGRIAYAVGNKLGVAEGVNTVRAYNFRDENDQEKIILDLKVYPDSKGNKILFLATGEQYLYALTDTKKLDNWYREYGRNGAAGFGDRSMVSQLTTDIEGNLWIGVQSQDQAGYYKLPKKDFRGQIGDVVAIDSDAYLNSPNLEQFEERNFPESIAPHELGFILKHGNNAFLYMVNHEEGNADLHPLNKENIAINNVDRLNENTYLFTDHGIYLVDEKGMFKSEELGNYNLEMKSDKEYKEFTKNELPQFTLPSNNFRDFAPMNDEYAYYIVTNDNGRGEVLLRQQKETITVKKAE